MIAAIQKVSGVEYVDVDAFGAIPEKTTDPNGTRRLMTQKEITKQVQAIVTPAGGQVAGASPIPDRLPANVTAWEAGSDGGVLRPAELVVLMAAVRDTIILNQIL